MKESTCKVISFMNMKGGVGKTTLCVNLAVAVSRQQEKVLLIDFDPQFNASQSMLSTSSYKKLLDEEKTMYSIYKKFVEDSDSRSMVSGDTKTQSMETSLDNIIYSIEENLDIIPSDLRLIKLTEIQDPGAEIFLKLEINKIKDKYNYIFIDSPPTFSFFTKSAIMASDYYMLPVKPEPVSVTGVSLFQESVKKYKENTTSPVKCLGIVLTMVKKGSLHAAHIEGLQKEHKFTTFSNQMRHLDTIARCPEKQRFLIDIKRSNINLEINNIAQEFIKKIRENS